MHCKKLLWVLLLFPALAWSQGISWGPRVRVDDALDPVPHEAIHPYTIIDDSLAANPRVYTVWEDDRDGNYKIFNLPAGSYTVNGYVQVLEPIPD